MSIQQLESVRVVGVFSIYEDAVAFDLRKEVRRVELLEAGAYGLEVGGEQIQLVDFRVDSEGFEHLAV